MSDETNVCERCGGSGKDEQGQTCLICEGTGVVEEAVGGG